MAPVYASEAYTDDAFRTRFSVRSSAKNPFLPYFREERAEKPSQKLITLYTAAACRHGLFQEIRYFRISSIIAPATASEAPVPPSISRTSA